MVGGRAAATRTELLKNSLGKKSPLALFIHTQMLATTLLAAAAASVAAALGDLAAIPLSGSSAHHVFDGIGALSAGASSRLLFDYPEPQRGDILDLLFKPNFGASLQILKVEIGGDSQSTDGSEPSHAHTRDDLSCGRGYESWLIAEAKARNPDIVTYGLSWAVPHWVGDGAGNGTGFHSPDNWAYQTQWLRCVENNTGYKVDWMGTWNEKNPGAPDYVTGLRAAFDAAGFADTLISVYDGDWSTGDVVAEALASPAFNASFASIGRHYPCDMPFPTVESAIHKKYWSSEDFSSANDWDGASCWARTLNDNYILNNMTATIAWSLIWSAPATLPFPGTGLMSAQEPWSGYYSGGDGAGAPAATPSLNGPLWTTAHTTQFSAPGWQYLRVGSGGSGFLPDAAGGGSFVALVPADLSELTLVVEKVASSTCKCARPNATSPPVDGTVVFALGVGLPAPGALFRVWRTNATTQFLRDADVAVGADGTLSVFVAQDSIVTLSTLSGATKGTPPTPPPPSAPFPLPYSDDFSRYAEDTTPVRFWADETGSFAARGGALRQVVEIDPGGNRWVNEDLDPITLLGDASLANVTISVAATFAPALNASGTGDAPLYGSSKGANRTLGFTYAMVCGRLTKYSGLQQRPIPGYCVGVNATGAWLVSAGASVLGAGQLPLPFDPLAQHALTLGMDGEWVTAWVLDGAPAAGGAPGAPPLLNVSSAAFPTGGLVGLASGYHAAAFADFSLRSAAAS